MKNYFYSELKQNFENKIYNIKSYDEIFDNFLKQVGCNAKKCDNLCQIKKSLAYILNKHRKTIIIKQRNEEIFSQILHDIKSPALGIKFALEGIKRSELEDEIYNINANTLELIQSFLTIYSFKDGKKKIEFEEFNLKEFVINELSVYKYLLKNSSLELCLECSYDVHIRSEKNIIRRILSNLITNAVKYAKENTQITIEIKKRDSCFIICMTNYVKNCEIQKVSDLFKKFNTDRADDSFGLGLFICKRLANCINSKINAFHKGDCITFELKIPKA